MAKINFDEEGFSFNLKWFQKPSRIGFIHKPFPVIKNSETHTKTYNICCKGHYVDVKVSVVQLEMKGFNSFPGILTSKISDSLPHAGFGSYRHLDEIHSMKQAVKQYCIDTGIQICNVHNNWPSFRADINLPKSWQK